MSQAELQLRALPNVEFVHGYPGIPAGADRAHASIRGFLEVRIGGQPVKAKWVKVEFRKTETIPSGKTTEEFIDHIGPGPITLWEAQNERDLLSSHDFPFNIRIPETIPPSVALEKGCGIKYELCATMSLIKRRKGFFRRESKTMVTNIVPVVIDKHELHSTWPIYGQHDSRQVSREDGIILVVDRGNTCFAPGDPLAIIATVRSENLRPVVIRSLELALEEAITFHGGSPGLAKKNTTNMSIVNIIGEHKLPLSYTLYGGTQQRVELAVNIPPNHTTTSVTTGRHIDIAYRIRVKCFLDNAAPLQLDLPLTMTNWPRNVSAELTRRIGVTPNLTSRPSQTSGPEQATLSAQDASSNIQSPAPPVPSKVTAPKVMSPTNGSTTAVIPATPVHALNKANQASVSTTDGKNQMIDSPRPSHEGAVSESGIRGQADELGYRQGDMTPATAPARIGQRRVSTSDSDDRRSEQLGGDGSLSGGSLNRRTKSAAATTGSRFKVVNPDHNIPEEPPSNTRLNSTVSLVRWATAEAEKEMLYEEAKAKVAQVQNFAFQVPHTNGHVSQSINGSYDIPRPVSQDTNRPWVSAENEKRRLYELAQARVHETQGQVAIPPPATESVRPPSSESRRPHADTQTQKSTRSAGAALYSRAIEQISRSSTIPAPQPPPHLAETRRNMSYTTSNRPIPQDKSAILYYQAQQKVRRHLQEQGEATGQEDGPIPYDQLFGGDAVASSSNHGHAPMPAISEKELVRRHHEEQDARTIAAQNNAVNRTSSIRSPSSGSAQSAPLSEKELMRRAFEARDAALRAAGQVPPPILPDYGPPEPAFNEDPRRSVPLSAAEEKTQLAERYGVDNGGSPNRLTPPMPPPVSQPQPQAAAPAEVLNVVAMNPTRERSVRSVGTAETLLRRDPSVSAGKRRQVNAGRDSPPPPPLPPRPPQEYIEETKREDHRTTLRSALPLDFSASFDLGFDQFGKDGRQTPDAPSQ